jgi:hypothetical protein
MIGSAYQVSPTKVYNIDGKYELWKDATPARLKMQFDYTMKICEDDTDFTEIYATELKFRKELQLTISPITDEVMKDYRENLI